MVRALSNAVCDTCITFYLALILYTYNCLNNQDLPVKVFGSRCALSLWLMRRGKRLTL